MGLEQYGIPLYGSSFYPPQPGHKCLTNGARTCTGGFTKTCQRTRTLGINEYPPYACGPWRGCLHIRAYVGGTWYTASMGSPYGSRTVFCTGPGWWITCNPTMPVQWMARYESYSGPYGTIAPSTWREIEIVQAPANPC